MKDAYFLIITKQKITVDLSNIDYLILNDDFELIDENHIKINNEEYEFTYLLFTNDLNYCLNNILLIEDNQPVTNFLKETSVENIYYTSNDVNEVINDLINE